MAHYSDILNPQKYFIVVSSAVNTSTVCYRVGWSVDGADLGLGEDRHSYGYGGTGKVATNRQFKEYGEPYGPGDFIGCFVVSLGQWSRYLQHSPWRDGL